MTLSKTLQNPRTINKIEPVDVVSFIVPTGAPKGYRVLIANSETGDQSLGSMAAPVGAFAGKIGQIAISDGVGGWAFDNTALYEDNQLLPVKGDRTVWIYWHGAPGFFQRIVDPDNLKIHEYHGYYRNQADTAKTGLAWTQRSLVGTAIVPNVNKIDFLLKEGYGFRIRHCIISARYSNQVISVKMDVSGANPDAGLYDGTDRKFGGCGVLEEKVIIPAGSGDRVLRFSEESNTGGSEHDATLSIEVFEL